MFYNENFITQNIRVTNLAKPHSSLNYPSKNYGLDGCFMYDYSVDMRHIQYLAQTLPLVLAFHQVLGKFPI